MSTKKKDAALSPITRILDFALQEKKCAESQANRPSKTTISFKVSETESVQLSLKTLLTLEEMTSFISDVVLNLFIDDEYHPENYNTVFAWLVLDYYAGINASSISLSQASQIIYQTDIVGHILPEVNQRQLDDIKAAIKATVGFKQQTIVSEQRAALERVSTQLALCADIMEKMSEQAKDVDLSKLAESTNLLAQKDEAKLAHGILEYHENNIQENK